MQKKQLLIALGCLTLTIKIAMTIAKLLRYCIQHGHWSIFEMANMVLEINTTRGIAAQILRHRSFSFQEFSQRYADASFLGETINIPDLRTQDPKK